MKNWAKEHAKGCVLPRQLLERGWIDAPTEDVLHAVKDNFDIRVPTVFFDALDKSNESIAKQVIPSDQELLFRPEELEDPIGDERHSPVDGITHRYPDRVLLKVTYQCAVYCRFCFRRYKVSKAEERLEGSRFENALQYISENKNIWEVILTGGDPLVLTDERLKAILQRLAEIPHVQVLRFHTRIPTVLPSRVTAGLIELLKQTNKSVWIVSHINSISELTPESEAALAALVEAGIPVLSQSVLLRGVNDTEEKLVALLRRLVTLRVKPYYLHYPDLAKGTNHFRIPLAKALDLVKRLRGRVSGLCLPQLMVDIPGGHGKVVIEAENARQVEEKVWSFRSPLTGEWHQFVFPEA